MSRSREEALALLRERAASVPDRIRMLGDPAAVALHANGFRAVRTTGVGSSGAHARALAEWLSDLGLDARYLPPSAFPAAHEAAHDADLLVAFSQGLSPNARLALQRPDAWRQVLVVTSTRPSDEGQQSVFAKRLEEAGVTLLDSGAADEFGTLVRVLGPATAYWTAWRIVVAFGAPAGPGAEAVASAIERAAERARAASLPWAPSLARLPLLWVASPNHVGAADNLRLKWVEGLLREVPPVVDVLDFAHGPFQALHDREAVVVSLCAQDDPHAEERLGRLDSLLVPERHTRIALEAELAHPLAVVEFEAGANELLLAALRVSAIDPGDWPGRGADAALYEIGRDASVRPAIETGRELVTATWPEIEARLADGNRVAIVPLGSTEQHGPHLPFATDTWIADELGGRLARALPEAVLLPTLCFGAASEHLAFPGTLSLSPDTLIELLRDIARSLSGHGFQEIFCFSAHGGNLGALRDGHERLREAAAPARWIAFTDHASLNAALFEVSKDEGLLPNEAGQHAGELETSILDAIRPGSVRRDRLARGRMGLASDGDSLFYPSLRDHSESGVVGDPRAASRERAARYLSTWTGVLVRTLEEARNSPSTTGTVNA